MDTESPQNPVHTVKSGFPSRWPRRSYWALWGFVLLMFLGGTILWVQGQVVTWVPTGSTNEYESHIVDLTIPATWLSCAGGVTAIIMLILDAYVGPLHRRTGAERRPEIPDE